MSKARLIVAALAAAGEPCTRHELAQLLKQPRLYDHDLQLLKRLQQAGLVIASRRRRLYIEMDRSPDIAWSIDNYERIHGRSQKYARWGKMDFMWEYWLVSTERKKSASGGFLGALVDRIKDLW